MNKCPSNTLRYDYYFFVVVTAREFSRAAVTFGQ